MLFGLQLSYFWQTLLQSSVQCFMFAVFFACNEECTLPDTPSQTSLGSAILSQIFALALTSFAARFNALKVEFF